MPWPCSHLLLPTQRGAGGLSTGWHSTRLVQHLLHHHGQNVGKCASRAKTENLSAGRISERNFQITKGFGQNILLLTRPFRRCLSLFYTSPNPLQLILRCCNFPQHSEWGLGTPSHVLPAAPRMSPSKPWEV